MVKLRVFSPNSSCALLRNIPFRNRVLLRLGSTTPLVSRYKYLELNTIEGVKTSGNKISMKRAFDEAGIIHSEWICSSKRARVYDFLKSIKFSLLSTSIRLKEKHLLYRQLGNIRKYM